MYLFDEPYHDNCCAQCESKSEQIDKCEYWIGYLVQLLYSNDSLEGLEHCVEELAHVVGLKIPSTPLMVDRKVNAECDFDSGHVLDAWKIASAKYLKSLTPVS